jgi:hypothetical protein
MYVYIYILKNGSLRERVHGWGAKKKDKNKVKARKRRSERERERARARERERERESERERERDLPNNSIDKRKRNILLSTSIFRIKVRVLLLVSFTQLFLHLLELLARPLCLHLLSVLQQLDPCSS